MKLCSPPEFFHKNMSHEQLLFMWSTFGDSSMGTKLKYFWRTHESEVRQNFFTKTCLTNNYFSCDPHYVILAWVQSWNIFEKLMKVCSPPEFFHKNMSHEQLLFMWSTLRDSSMGKKVEIFLKSSWKCVVSRNFFHKKMSHEQLPFMWSTLRDSSMGTKLKYFWKTHESV